MKLEDTLEVVRARYLAFYDKAFSLIEKRHSSAVKELPLQLDINPNEYRSLWRIDITYYKGEAPQLVEVNLDQKTEVPRQYFQFGKTTVSVEPMIWNAIELRTNLQEVDEAPLRDWLEKAIDVDEKYTNQGPEVGFLHSLDACFENGYLSLSIDFGTAPVSAFIELLSLLQDQGATSVSVGSWEFA